MTIIFTGCYDTISEYFEENPIKILAQEANAGEDDMVVYPLMNTGRKGGEFPMMLHQFRRAISGTRVKGNANHKLGRIHYVRGTTEEAVNTRKINLSNYRHTQ